MAKKQTEWKRRKENKSEISYLYTFTAHPIMMTNARLFESQTDILNRSALFRNNFTKHSKDKRTEEKFTQVYQHVMSTEIKFDKDHVQLLEMGGEQPMKYWTIIQDFMETSNSRLLGCC